MNFRVVRLLFLLAIVFVALPMVGQAQIFFAYLTPAQEVPPVASTATGYARVVLNEGAGTINFTVVFNGLSSAQNASHIHTAAIGATGPITIDFGAVGGTSGTISGTRAITGGQITALRSNGMYVNVHSANFGAGEIRGQLGKRRPVDFDGDGRQDYSVLKFPAVGDPRPITYWNQNSTTGLQTGTWGNALTDYPTPGDFDGDGRDDLAIYRDGVPATPQSAFWIFRSSNSTLQYFAWGVDGDLVAARDYDGDGITDPAVFRRGAVAGDQAFWYILQSSNGTARIEPWGTTGTSGNNDFPVPGDYDGDGRYDIAVYRTGTLIPTNTFIVKRSSDNTAVYRNFGNFNSDYIVPGDYDGDGRFDFAVARTGALSTSPLVWWINLSSNNTIRVQHFGITSDLPVQGDYDGDARTDIAVYRQGAAPGNSSLFWVLRSHTLTSQATIWGVNPDFPTASFDAR